MLRVIKIFLLSITLLSPTVVLAQDFAYKKAQLTPGMAIRVIVNGIVHIEPLTDKNASRIEWSSAGKVQVSGQNIRIKGQAKIFVPQQVSVNIEMGEGEVYLNDLANNIVLKGDHGKVSLSNHLGSAKIKLDEGNLVVVHSKGNGGEIEAEVKNGRINLDWRGGKPGGGKAIIKKNGAGVVRIGKDAKATLWVGVVKGSLKVDSRIGRMSKNRCYLTAGGGGEGFELLVQQGWAEIEIADQTSSDEK